MKTALSQIDHSSTWNRGTTFYGDDVITIEREPARVLDHCLLLDLLTAALADERTGVMLYYQHVGDASAEMYDTLVACAAQIEQHVRLLERTITQLGADPPSWIPSTWEWSDLHATSLPQWIAHLEALVAFETRDQILWAALNRLSRRSLDVADADIVRAAVQQVESAEALGACNGRRHDERIRWARDTMRDLLAVQHGLGAPRYRTWHVLAGFLFGS